MRARVGRGPINGLRLRSFEILCEECGTIYDGRTAEGLCWSCADGEESGYREEDEASRVAVEPIRVEEPGQEAEPDGR